MMYFESSHVHVLCLVNKSATDYAIRRHLVVSRADVPMKERGQQIMKRLEDEHLVGKDDLPGFMNAVLRFVRAYHSRKAQLESLATAYPRDISGVMARHDYTKAWRASIGDHLANFEKQYTYEDALLNLRN